MTNDCASVFDPAQVLFLGDTCLQIVGIEEGEMQACIVLCDDLGVCDTTILIISVVDTSHELVIYTGYSPNGDDINEYFRIKNIEDYPDNELIIFNRWGNRVYEQKSYSNEKPWTGYWGNKILPDGTYFYILDVVIDGKKRKFSGHVELRR
jgi:gliding motility-associated-like protein